MISHVLNEYMYVCRPLYLHHIWKYVNSKTKYIEKIGDLKKKNEQGDTLICSSAKTKAEALCEFFSSIVYNEADDDLNHLKIDRVLMNLCQC